MFGNQGIPKEKRYLHNIKKRGVHLFPTMILQKL
jgi:hypothetical protein